MTVRQEKKRTTAKSYLQKVKIKKRESKRVESDRTSQEFTGGDPPFGGK